MKSVVVFCGSAMGAQVQYKEAARDLGKALAVHGVTVIYGGAKIGLMGAVADACLSAGGKVVGVIPQFLKKKEVVHEGLTELVTVETMHERKRIMIDKSEGCITLPGGYGTLEELFELLTDQQLGQYHYPIYLLNTGGYYDAMLRQLDHMVQEGLLKLPNRKNLLVYDKVADLMEAITV